MFLYILLLSVALVAIAFVGFAVSVLFKKGGQFPETSVGKNKALRAKKIYCIKTEQKIIDTKIKNGDDSICQAC